PVDCDGALPDQTLDGGAGEAGGVGAEENVKALRGLARGDGHAAGHLRVDLRLVPEEVQNQEAHADGDRRIGHVEGGPVMAQEREVEEVYDFAGADAVDEVADGPAE